MNLIIISIIYFGMCHKIVWSNILHQKHVFKMEFHYFTWNQDMIS